MHCIIPVAHNNKVQCDAVWCSFELLSYCLVLEVPFCLKATTCIGCLNCLIGSKFFCVTFYRGKNMMMMMIILMVMMMRMILIKTMIYCTNFCRGCC